MPSLREIRKRIAAVKNIKQITYAMKMVASARIKKAQSQILSLKPYAVSLEDVISTLKNEMTEDDFKISPAYRFFSRSKTDHIAVVVISGDKGLCGSFNTNILTKALKLIKENFSKKIHLICVGRKSVDFFRKVKNISVDYTMVSIFPKVSYSHASVIAENLVSIYDRYNIEKVYVVYGEFRNMLVQEVKTSVFLPLEESFKTKSSNKKYSDLFIFEPDNKIVIIEELIKKYINISLFRYLLETQASELAARMNAMELANKNATELVEQLTLNMNKLRQAQITTELSEIVGGAQAINK